jgi:hypothetical protein
MTELTEAVNAILKYILVQLAIEYQPNVNYVFYTKDEEIYVKDEMVRRDETLASLIDAYNLLLYGKLWKK